MPSWTDEQRDAIYKDNSNIIVSAGAGSGKTAVLTERVLEKVKRGISLKNLLILTFTNMAAKEMRERIESKLKKEGLTEELKNLPSADIVTFDAYALSLVKKYHYVLNVSKDIGIIEPTVIELQKRKILEEIFEDLYSSKDETFLSLIKEYFLKDDRELFSFILLVNSKLDLKSNKLEYLDNYLDLTFNDNKIEDDIALFRSELLKLITKIANYLENIDDQDYLNKLEEALNPLLNSKSYDEIKANLEVKLPIAKGVSDITKKYKDKITNTIKELKDLTVYTEEKEIKNSILITKNYIEVIIDIIKKLDSKVNEYKEKYDYYEYHDISNLAIKLVRENLSIRERA